LAGVRHELWRYWYLVRPFDWTHAYRCSNVYPFPCIGSKPVECRARAKKCYFNGWI